MREHPRRKNRPGLFVLGGQVPTAEEVATAVDHWEETAANLAAAETSSPPPAGSSTANLPVPAEIAGVHGVLDSIGGRPAFVTGEALTREQSDAVAAAMATPDAVAAAILWDQSTAAEPWQRDVTRSLDDTVRMGNSLSAAVRLELLAEDLRAQVLDRPGPGWPADEEAAPFTDDITPCVGDHAPMLNGRCALCSVRLDPVTGAQLDDDGLPVDQADDVWEHTAELPRLTVADLQAELAPRIYSAPPPPRDQVAAALRDGDRGAVFVGPPVVMTPARSRSTGGAAARILNWTSRHDVKSLEYGVRARLAAPAPLVDRSWPHGPILDQGTTPPLSLHDASGCTGHAAANAANVLALGHAGDPDLYGHEDAMRLYDRAQELDDVPGEDYPGTSVLAVMRAGQEFGMWDSYLWAFGTRDVAQALLQVGPVVIGIPWRSGMTEPGPDGIVTVSGQDMGGHALCLYALRMSLAGRAGPWFGALQTWGESVGDHGLIWFHHRDLAVLLHSVGEAAIPVVQR